MGARPPGARLGRIVLLVLLLAHGLAAKAAEFERGLLWKIWRPGVSPSYLFGTLHFPDPRLQQLPEPVEEALRSARRFVMEMYPDEWVAARFREAGQLPPGQRLTSLIDPPVFDALTARIRGRGWDRAQLETLRPWAALLALTARRAGEGVLTIDNALYIKARIARLRVEELDSVEEQIAVFDSVPIDTQIALLTAYVGLYEQLDPLADRTVEAYRRGDLAALQRLNRAIGGEALAPHLAVLEKKVIHDRSVVMAHRLQSHLRSGGTFAAVGALHLYGAKGMLSLLRADGWRIEHVY